MQVGTRVQQNPRTLSFVYSQLPPSPGKNSFMRVFEGSWTLEPRGEGTLVSLRQLLEPNSIPPFPLDRYVRYVTKSVTLGLIKDLRAEAER